MRGYWSVVLVLATFVTASADESCSSGNGDLVEIKLGLEWFLNPDHLPLVVAKQEGIFAELGINVTLIEPADHWEAEQEILAGRLDVAVTEPLHLAQDAAENKPILGFSRFFHTDGGVMYFKGGVIKRPKDMCGSTITYPGSPGVGGPSIVQTMVEADGGTCDITKYGKHNGGFYHVQSLKDKKADVATLVFYNFEVVEARAAGFDADFFSLKDWGVPDFCQLVLMTTPEKYQQLKPSLRALVLGMRRATGLIHREPARATAHYMSYLEARRRAPDAAERESLDKTMQATLSAFPNDNSMTHDYYTNLMDWLVRTGQVSAEQANRTTVDYWTNEISL